MMLDYERIQEQQKMAGSYAGAQLGGNVNAATTAVSPNGLARIADQITTAVERVGQITSQLNLLAHGIHGPRPEEVGNGHGNKQPYDSLQSRVNSLSEAVEALHAAYASVLR